MRLIALSSSNFMVQESSSSEKLIKSNSSTGALLNPLFSVPGNGRLVLFTKGARVHIFPGAAASMTDARVLNSPMAVALRNNTRFEETVRKQGIHHRFTFMIFNRKLCPTAVLFWTPFAQPSRDAQKGASHMRQKR